MKKKLNVIQINGFTGMLLVVFIAGCAITGFILFPSWCCMNIWNFLGAYVNFPSMNMLHGAMSWIILCLLFVVLNQNKNAIRFGSISARTEKDVKKVLNEIKEAKITPLNSEIEEKENVKK